MKILTSVDVLHWQSLHKAAFLKAYNPDQLRTTIWLYVCSTHNYKHKLVLQMNFSQPIAESRLRPRLTICCGGNPKQYLLDPESLIQRFLIARKDLNQKSIFADAPFKITKVLYPEVTSLSSEHAILTIWKKCSGKDLKRTTLILDKILKRKLQWELLETIISFLLPQVEVLIQDQGSLCGTYIPKNRPLQIENFWLLSENNNYSFGVYYLSSPALDITVSEDPKVIHYLQNTHLQCSNDSLADRIRFCNIQDPKEVGDLYRDIVFNYDVAVLSHKSIGYSFVVEKGQKISILNLFDGRLKGNQLIVESVFQVYTNICKARVLKNFKPSDVYRIGQKGTLILGDRRFQIQVAY